MWYFYQKAAIKPNKVAIWYTVQWDYYGIISSNVWMNWKKTSSSTKSSNMYELKNTLYFETCIQISTKNSFNSYCLLLLICNSLYSLFSEIEVSQYSHVFFEGKNTFLSCSRTFCWYTICNRKWSLHVWVWDLCQTTQSATSGWLKPTNLLDHLVDVNHVYHLRE